MPCRKIPGRHTGLNLHSHSLTRVIFSGSYSHSGVILSQALFSVRRYSQSGVILSQALFSVRRYSQSGVILSQALFSVRRYSQSFVNLISTPTCSATWCLSVKQAPVSPFILNKLCECTEYHYWLSNIGCLGYRTP